MLRCGTQCADFKPLMDVRKAFAELYYGADEISEGWTEDIEAEVDNLDAEPSWDSSDSETESD